MKDIRPGEVVYTKADGQDVTLPADTVVLAMGSRSENSLAKALENTGVEVRVIGDAAKPAKISDAIDAGFALAREV